MTAITTRGRAERRFGSAVLHRIVRRDGLSRHALLLITLVASAFPLYWTLVVASQTNEVISRPTPPLFLGGHLFENIARVFDTTDFALALFNSLVVSGCITVSVLVFSSLAGFAFAKLRFRGRNALFLVIVATMMIPVQLGVIPLYMLMSRLGWTGKLEAVIVPSMVTAFGVFFMRQYIAQAVPTELVDAARVDGCNTARIYFHAVLPPIRPAMAVLGLLTFMQAWNDFMWPLIVLTPDDPTVQVALSTLASGYYQDYSLVLAGTVLATAPVVLLFAALGRHIIDGILEGAVKA